MLRQRRGGAAEAAPDPQQDHSQDQPPGDGGWVAPNELDAPYGGECISAWMNPGTLRFHYSAAEAEFGRSYSATLLSFDSVSSAIVLPVVLFTMLRAGHDLRQANLNASLSGLLFCLCRGAPTLLRLCLPGTRYAALRPAVMAGVRVARLGQYCAMLADGVQGFTCGLLKGFALEQVFTTCGTAVLFPTLFRHHMPLQAAMFLVTAVMVGYDKGLCHSLAGMRHVPACARFCERMGMMDGALRDFSHALVPAVWHPPATGDTAIAVPAAAGGGVDDALPLLPSLQPPPHSCATLMLFLVAIATASSSVWLYSQELKARAAFLRARHPGRVFGDMYAGFCFSLVQKVGLWVYLAAALWRALSELSRLLGL